MKAAIHAAYSYFSAMAHRVLISNALHPASTGQEKNVITKKAIVVAATLVLILGALWANQNVRADDSATPNASGGSSCSGCPMEPKADVSCAGSTVKDEKLDPATTIYQCPMNPEATTTDPNASCKSLEACAKSEKCAKCDAKLEAKTVYACPMHPDQWSLDPDKKCDTCGMNLAPAQVYACSMHPDQWSTDKDAKCSLCGMKMEPIGKEEDKDKGMMSMPM